MYTIDSRECVRKTKPETNTGMWICMHCGGAKEYASQRFCPACKSMNIDILHDGAVRCKELDCGLDGAKYGKEPVSVEEIYRFDKFRKTSRVSIIPPVPMDDEKLPF
jgi:ribosomal protein L37AE/L43A